MRVVLAPELSIGAMQQVLRRTQLQIVSGPTEAGVYTLGAVSGAAARPDLPVLLAQLRAQPGVRFAEPVGTP